MESTPITLLDYTSGKPVEAWLHDEITPAHLEAHNLQWNSLFRVYRQQYRTGQLSKKDYPEDAHWDWNGKMAKRRGKLGFASFCIEVNESIEGLLILSYLVTCRLPDQIGKDLVYIEYLATAPWNRPIGGQIPRYRRVGSFLTRAAIQMSFENDLKGRLGLHSLPKAESFYRDKIGLTDLGPDPDPRYQGLRYFELSEARALEIKV